jgi:putative membrane protein insertion efficiency factor
MPDAGTPDRKPLSTRIAIACFRAPIQLYRLVLSPFMGPARRHVPSCSEYALEAIERHGAWRGGWLTLSRLARCNPWGSHGLDPVPEEWPARYGLLSSWRYGRWSGQHIEHGFHEDQRS